MQSYKSAGGGSQVRCRWCCSLLNHVWPACQSPHMNRLKMDACFQYEAVSCMYLVSLSWWVGWVCVCVSGGVVVVCDASQYEYSRFHCDCHLNSSRGIKFPAVWKTFNEELVSHKHEHTHEHTAEKRLLVLDDWESVANKGCLSSSLHNLFTYDIFHVSYSSQNFSCYSGRSCSRTGSHFFLFHWNPSLSVDDKKLKRRQLPLCALMCSRNNSSQSRPELQSVSGVPVRQEFMQWRAI